MNSPVSPPFPAKEMHLRKDHMSRQFDSELKEIRVRLLEMGGTVELMIANSMRSLVERDSLLAEQTIALDAEVNAMEREIDEKCLHILAKRQPAARDLRFVTLALKIVTDLERIGDQCASIAGHALQLNCEAQLKPYIDLPRMAEAANNAVKDALDAFVRGDAQTAVRVCRDDYLVDELNEQLQRELLTFMMEDTAAVGRAMRINSISKYLERIADHATNIAEMVIFMVEGKDIRHTTV
jgi:phosphate transport system protein